MIRLIRSSNDSFKVQQKMSVQASQLTDNARYFTKDGRWFRDSLGRYVLFRE
jgi:hypothetical protein